MLGTLGAMQYAAQSYLSYSSRLLASNCLPWTLKV